MNHIEIEKNVKELSANINQETFVYDLLLAYGLPQSSITLLKDGNRNLSKDSNEVSWKLKILYREEFNQDLHLTISDLASNIQHKQRIVIVTDYKTLLEVDTKTLDKLDISISELPKNYDFFLPWAGIEKTQYHDENPADVRAAENMGKLFDRIKEDNPDESPEFTHGLNVFLSRLLFCFFAEDTNIFKENQFTSSIGSHTQSDGSDLHIYLAELFKVLNTPVPERNNLPDYMNDFPYVNGELFKEEYQIPVFKTKSRQAIIDSGQLDWSSINPDIFGSMFQAVVGETERGNLGMHYTSVPNIMKVIKPLFLDDLYEAFDKSIGNNKKLIKLAYRLSKIKIFDPACGSGNFLIIAFKELKRLEMEIFKELGSFNFSQITPSQFYGIEIDDFAHEIAKLSLWLTEHQMNIEFFNEFQRVNPTLPLKKAGNITCANATRIDWEEVCPKEQNDEIYVLGNPPYLGASMQEKVQKEDKEIVFSDIQNYKNLDYIACWFYKGSSYIKDANIKLSFVTTNSINQGEQVSIFWPHVFNKGLEIFFAYQSFKWSNSAKKNAGVIVAIIGLRNKSKDEKYLYKLNVKQKVKNINWYLVNASNTSIKRASSPISNIPKMVLGDAPKDGGNLILSLDDKNNLIADNPHSELLIKKYIGAYEYINNIDRWCLWIEDDNIELANSIPDVALRIEKVRSMRLSSKKAATRVFSEVPHKFVEIRYLKSESTIIVPNVSSERRTYVPIGFLDSDTIIANSASAVYDSEPWVFSLITSRIHMAWMRVVAGRLKTDYRYSSALVYNTFPFPNISKSQKEELNQQVFNILSEREKHPEKTLAHLYDPDKMPDGLREAHHQNDLAIERCYRSKPFENDEERLEYLFKLYEKMIAEEEAK